MTTGERSPRLIIPALGPLYDALSGYAWPLVRITAGAMLIPHGARNLFGWFGGAGLAETGAFFAANLGLEPGLLWALLVGVTEFFGGLALVLGFLARPVALAVFIEMMGTIFLVHLPNGFFWNEGGVEYPLMWGLVALAIVLRGAGPLSLDARLGREV